MAFNEYQLDKHHLGTHRVADWRDVDRQDAANWISGMKVNVKVQSVDVNAIHVMCMSVSKIDPEGRRHVRVDML